MKCRFATGILVAFALTAAACGDSDEPAADPPETSESATSAAPDTTAVAEIPDVVFQSLDSSPEPGSGDGLVIGYINAGDSSPYWAAVSQSMAENAEIAGAELINCDTDFDAANALECARTFATRGVDVIISSNIDSATASEICAAGPDVPTLATWIPQDPCEVSFFGADDIAAGTVFGTALGEYFDTEFGCEYDSFVSLEQVAAGEANLNRMAGAREGFESVCGDAIDFRSIDTGGTVDGSQTAFADVLTALTGAERIAVVCLNDDSCVGAVAAARIAGREDNIYVASAGADTVSHCEILTNPNWVGSVGYFPARQGNITIPLAIGLAKGDVAARTILMDQDFVTSENIQTFFPEVSAASC